MVEQDPRLNTWKLVQARGQGVTKDGTLADIETGGWVVLIRPPASVEPSRTLAFARSQVGDRYGFWTIASIIIDILTPKWFHTPFRRPGTWICSALGAEALRFGGWLHQWPDIYQVDPADAMQALLGSGGKEITVDEAQPGDVGFSHTRGLVDAAIRLGQRIRRQPEWRVNHMFILDRKCGSNTPVKGKDVPT
jgi:hypothetical protein